LKLISNTEEDFTLIVDAGKILLLNYSIV